MFEFLLAEWHITPDYIVRNWTHELLNLMIVQLARRKKRETEAIKSHHKGEGQVVSDTELFAQMGNSIKVEN